MKTKIKTGWCYAWDLFGSLIPVTTGVFELRICSWNPTVFTEICDPSRS